MKVTYNWLKDFVEIKIPAQELAEKLTMAGLEVTSLDACAKDFVFEIEVTPNRPDCLSVIGIAREVAAITGKKLSRYPIKQLTGLNKSREPLAINIENRIDCPLYTAKIIRDVRVSPSTDWLKERLELVGCRSVNNIVDITNYILYEWGEPLHAFDLDKLLQGAVLVRRARNSEKIITIDGETRVLSADILVIADKEKPIAIAGVMGGKDTEVTAMTKNVLLEAAVFNPALVRRCRQKLGLASESAYRFERGVDFGIVEGASLRAVELMEKIAAGRCVFSKKSGSTITKRKIVDLGLLNVERVLDININLPRIKKILDTLEFKTKIKGKNRIEAEIPSHRGDVKLEIDLIEEIARIFGYQNLPQDLPAVKPRLTSSAAGDFVSQIKNILVGLGLNEVITYSLIDKNLLMNYYEGLEGAAVEILNPLSSEQEVLRPSLLPGLCRCIAYNLNQKQEHVNIFEIAKIFSSSENQPKEEMSLGIALSGVKSGLTLAGSIREEASLLHLKGALEIIFERIGIKDYSFQADKNSFTLAICLGTQKIGEMAKLKRDTLDRMGIKNKEVFVSEILLEKVLPHVRLNKEFSPPPKFPGISRDISFVLKEDVMIKDVLRAIQEKGEPLLRGIKVIDYYQGSQIPPGCRGLTISLFYRSDDRTLTEKEINPLHSQLCNILTERFEAKLRST